MTVKRLLSCLTFAIVTLATPFTNAQNRQITPDMIRKAQSMGLDADALSKKSGMGSDAGLSKRNLPETDIRRTRNEMVDTLNSTGMSNEYDILPLGPSEVARQKFVKDSMLKNSIFGHDIFSGRNLSFAPSYNMPTPTNYVLGSGDKLLIDVTGSVSSSYDPIISPDGAVMIPNVGLIPVAGMTIEAATKRIRERLASTVEGINSGDASVNVSLGDVRSIKVNIIGEASMPGTYTLPAISSLFNAIYSAGGVNEIGSMRNIKLIRDGKQIAALDIYDYLLHNKQEVNMGLRDGDMIVINPYENLVTVRGNVKRPRIYEMRKGQNVKELIGYAGGFTGDAYTGQVNVDRKSGLQKSIHSVASNQFELFTLTDGDTLRVDTIIDKYANRVTVVGALWRPGDFELKDSTNSVLRLINQARGLKGDAMLNRAQIIRQRPDLTLEVIAFDLGAMINGTIPDIELQAEDILKVATINSLQEEQTFVIKGEVNIPDSILPFKHKMTIQDAIMLAGGLKESASLARIEVARRVKNPNSTETTNRIAELFEFKIPKDLVIDPETANFELQPFDQVFIRPSPGYSKQQAAFIFGDVIFPGEYVLLSRSDRLSDLVMKAGGLGPEAYAKGAYLKRRVSEDRLARIETLESLNQRGKSVFGDTVLNKKMKIGDYYPIAIDLTTAVLAPDSPENLILQEGDMLVVPKFSSTVTISGAVLFPCVVTYQEGMKIKDYVARGGGYASRAKKSPFIIYANGMPLSRRSGRNPVVEPGCEIVVPQKELKKGLSTMGPMEISTLASSTVSMLAVLTSLFRR